MNPIQKLTELGQSLWYDNIQRRLLENGDLKTMITRGDIRGVTSNPSIFHNAIANSDDYDSALVPLSWAGWDAEKIFWQLAIEDIQSACDLFLPLYRETASADGYVSIEVSPYLANQTEKTARQAVELWKQVDRPNLMIKIPATHAGIPAIRQTIAAGINVNVTLIFSLERYAEVMDAYLSGLEDRLEEGKPVNHIASVASFFISRLDSKVDAGLPEGSDLRGRAAIANARLAYASFTQTFDGPRWKSLQARGARYQRPLWASTSTKNPAYPDTLYVNSLIGPHTVNTVPPNTLDAFRDHGQAKETITQEMDQARILFDLLARAGISIDDVTQELEDEGVQAFGQAFTALLDTIETRRLSAVDQLGPLSGAVQSRIIDLAAEKVPGRLWDGDPTLWTSDSSGRAEVKKRLGWLTFPETSKSILPELTEFSKQVNSENIQRVLLLGMGGSSLAPEVMSFVFASKDLEESAGKSCLSILDSTDPAQVAQAANEYPPDKSLYVVSSKSGGTAEVMAAFEYFWTLSGQDGSRFVAVTDPGSSLEKLAKENGFRKVFTADPNVGGRYSALTVFGLVPAALLGVDAEHLLHHSGWMMKQSRRDVIAARNPGLTLGAVMAEAALRGRDKLTILADAPLVTVGSWLEQLIAESSGKNGKGIVPVDLEPIGDVTVYGKDRLFVYLRQTGDYDQPVTSLRKSGHLVVEIPVPGPYFLGAEFYRWEMATAVACHILGVNAFDQPDVEDAKVRARGQIAAYQEKGMLADGEYVTLMDAKSALEEFLKQAEGNDYISISAFLPRNSNMITGLQALRVAIREQTKAAVTMGFGPRFLHSTGQLHKGGANNGLFLQITATPVEDLEIPMQKISFGTLERAQAMGDYEALQSRARRILRIHLARPDDVQKLVGLVN